MAEGGSRFDYVALDAAGRRIRGRVEAGGEAQAFERLRRDGLSPVRLKPARDGGAGVGGQGGSRRMIDDRRLSALLGSLADLLRAGADIRSALGILGGPGAPPAVREFCRKLGAQIGGGEAVEAAFARNLPSKDAFVAAFVAAGEASGDLPGGLQRAGDLMASRDKLREQLISTLSYPVFVLVSTVAALLVILLFVVPTLTPLVETSDGPPPLVLGLLMGASSALQTIGPYLAVGAGVSAIAFFVLARAGLLAEPLDRLLVEGPMGPLVRPLVFGRFAIGLGGMLAAGAPMSDALRLAVRGVASPTARERLAGLAPTVRQGLALSTALERVRGFPTSAARLAAVGEASGALGQMLARGGRLEEEEAMRRIEAFGRMAGPVLIVLLGGVIGLLMAGLLSSVAELGEAALR